MIIARRAGEALGRPHGHGLMVATHSNRPILMTKLQPEEIMLSGRWIVENGEAHGDAVCDRIAWLLSNRLRKLADSRQWGAWQTLYQDPDDGRYWERTYPQGELHGGGPPQLQSLSKEEAKQKYGDVVT
jgi:Immunity protein 27